MKRIRSLPSSTLASPWLYFGLAFTWTWLFLVPLAIFGVDTRRLTGQVLGAVGLLGPALAGIGLTYLTQGPAGGREYWRRVIDLRRIRAGGWAALLVVAPGLTLLAGGLDTWLGGAGIAWEDVARRLFAQPWRLAYYLPFLLLFGPLPEELGWRGYALDRLQARYSPLMASLALGCAWAAWHLPLFFVPGTYQHGLGVGTPAFWLFMTAILPETVLITWIYNHTGRSTLAAVLFHFMINLTGELTALNPRAELLMVLLWFAAALGLVLAGQLAPPTQRN